MNARKYTPKKSPCEEKEHTGKREKEGEIGEQNFLFHAFHVSLQRKRKHRKKREGRRYLGTKMADGAVNFLIDKLT